MSNLEEIEILNVRIENSSYAIKNRSPYYYNGRFEQDQLLQFNSDRKHLKLNSHLKFIPDHRFFSYLGNQKDFRPYGPKIQKVEHHRSSKLSIGSFLHLQLCVNQIESSPFYISSLEIGFAQIRSSEITIFCLYKTYSIRKIEISI